MCVLSLFNVGSPEFQSSSSLIRVNASDSFTISCCINSSCPLSTTITLRYDGRGSPLSSNPLNLSNNDCNQSFTNVQESFNGSYTCEARNIHDQVTKAYDVFVVPPPPPGKSLVLFYYFFEAHCICIMQHISFPLHLQLLLQLLLHSPHIVCVLVCLCC